MDTYNQAFDDQHYSGPPNYADVVPKSVGDIIVRFDDKYEVKEKKDDGIIVEYWPHGGSPRLIKYRDLTNYMLYNLG